MFKILNPNYQEEIRQKVDSQEFVKLIGFQMTSIEPGQTQGVLEIKPIHRQHNGFIHGGLTASLLDTVAGFAAGTLLPKGVTVVTAELKVAYFLPALDGTLTATGWVEKQGQMLYFCEADLWNSVGENRHRIAKASATMAVVKIPGS